MTTQHSNTREPDASDLEEQPDTEEPNENADEDHKLDEAIEMTFPASDPISITPA